MSDDHHAGPEASRPSLAPQYGILGATEGAGLLSWAWAAERLATSRGYWIATTRRDGRPHMAMVWGVWLHDRFCFSTHASSRKARNLAANPACVVSPEGSPCQTTITRGLTRAVRAWHLSMGFSAYAAKYQEDASTGDPWVVFQVRPNVVFAFISDAEQYPATATRWRFDDQA